MKKNPKSPKKEELNKVVKDAYDIFICENVIMCIQCKRIYILNLNCSSTRNEFTSSRLKTILSMIPDDQDFVVGTCSHITCFKRDLKTSHIPIFSEEDASKHINTIFNKDLKEKEPDEVLDDFYRQLTSIIVGGLEHRKDSMWIEQNSSGWCHSRKILVRFKMPMYVSQKILVSFACETVPDSFSLR